MSKKKLKNNFHKTLLQSYILTRCDRRLFLELSKNKPKLWVDPDRSIKKPKRIPRTLKFLKELGKIYEQDVYSRLRKLKNVRFQESNGQIDKLKLDVSELEKIFTYLKDNPGQDITLLEFEFTIPSQFFHKIFPPKNGITEIPVDYGKQRPDITIIGNGINERLSENHELLPNGSFRKIPKNEMHNRFGISIFDIKKTQEEKIGKKHFVEVLYYMWTFSQYLKINHLDDKFYLRGNFNGIFPDWDLNILDSFQDLQEIFEKNLVTLINWEEARRIFFQLVKKIRHLWENSPCPIEDIDLNIHQGCGYCQYFEDCKETLGCMENSDPSTWSLKLIPFTSPSIARQLINEYGYETIGDVARKIDSIKVGIIPKPLYPELPLLKLKAEALIKDELIYPRGDQTHSYEIPKYSTIALNFGVEYDSNNDRVFACGIYLKMFVYQGMRYFTKFTNWWKEWRSALQNFTNHANIRDALNVFLIQEIPLEIVERFHDHLQELKGISISLKGEKNTVGTEVQFAFSEINEGLEVKHEAKLMKEMLSKLFAILEMTTIIEDYIVAEEEDGKIVFKPNTSLFYWGKEQLDHFQDMIERNIQHVIDDANLSSLYQNLLLYFTPSDTEVANPYQHKKLFDIQKFAESFVGFPDIINYTWHGIAHKLFSLNISYRYWIPHFNFLDLNEWLSFLSSKKSGKDLMKIQENRSNIQKQQMFKLRMIDRIRSQFQRGESTVISKHARPVTRSKYRSAILPSHYHAIAHVWYIFSMRTSTLKQQEAEFYRSMFPDYSIGKMIAARVTDLSTVSSDNKVFYKFNVKGLSSNMKLKEGDRVLLIPQAKRDLNPNREMYQWSVIIKSITWDSDINGNRIITEKTNNDIDVMCKKEKLPSQKEWFLYPMESDPWSHKLHKANNTGLLQRYDFGASWLGHRLSWIWKIRTNPELWWPSRWEFGTPSIYLHSPELFFDKKRSSSQLNNLLTTIHPAPDPSQVEAIKNSLQNTISAILGPPGTGKSQTVAALLDEYLNIRKKEGKISTKILITSFSYAALKVVIDKVRESKDKDGFPTLSSQAQLVFLRSPSRSAIEKRTGYKDVDDLMKRGNTWEWNGETRTVTNTHPLEERLEDNIILFANAHQLFHLPDRVDEHFAFDLICVDEASQMPVDHMMSSLQFIHKKTLKLIIPQGAGAPNSPIIDHDEIRNLTLDLSNDIDIGPLTKVVIVGDHNQLPPVRSISPPKNLEPVLNSLFSYYVDGHEIPSRQLKINYRSHQDIVDFTSSLGFYQDLKAHDANANKLLNGNIDNVKQTWLKVILKPERVVSAISHYNKFEIGISLLEADLVKQIVMGYYRMLDPKTKSEERVFWTKKVGVVAPHNAQGSTIIRELFQELEPITRLEKPTLMNYLKSTVYSVEKFQGSDRDLIITSLGLSDVDKISSEADFIFNLNRFNVLTSRAKSKLIFIASKEILKYIPDDRKVIESSSKFDFYVNKFCNKRMNLTMNDEKGKSHKIKFKFRQRVR